MVERRDTGVTRHAGGWIVLGAGLLLVCLRSAAFQSPSRIDGSPWLGGRESQSDRTGIKEFPALSIDINEANEAELSCIAGIGPALAQRIVAHRQRAGRFVSLDQVEKIPGVGPQLTAQLKAAINPPLTDRSSEPEHPGDALVGRHLKSQVNEPLHD